MKKVITSERLPVKLWLEDIEEGALEQAKDLANLPFTFRHVAIMPDSHQGYGMPIGGVLPTQGAIIPNAVGVDIGCGMLAVKTNLKAYNGTEDSLKNIMQQIRDTVPVGFSHQPEKQDADTIPSTDGLREDSVIPEFAEESLHHVGTLGGGNHFIEIQKDADHTIWYMIHSGSRGVGYNVAQFYIDKAKELCEQWYSDIPNKHLSFFPRGSEWFDRYLHDMKWMVDFARCNRELMAKRVGQAFQDNSIGYVERKKINKPHNYADFEHHFGEDVMVHRKGACRAREGEQVMIPGSQGASSFIVRGKGNEISFKSCSHGAGRVMSRTKAQETLSVEEETKHLDNMGVLHAIRGKDDLDEAPSSYKDIRKVMSNQKDLVEIETELTPMGVIKG